MKRAFSHIKEGGKEIIRRPNVRRVIPSKGVWSIFGGGLVFLIVLIGIELGVGSAAMGIGIMYTARGIGTGLGPIVARILAPNQDQHARALALVIPISGLFYLCVALLPWKVWLTVSLIVIAHMASGANWVLSTTLLQQRSEDEWRGRLMGIDMLIVTAFMGISTLLASAMIDVFEWTLRSVVLLFSIGLFTVGTAWGWHFYRTESGNHASS